MGRRSNVLTWSTESGRERPLNTTLIHFFENDTSDSIPRRVLEIDLFPDRLAVYADETDGFLLITTAERHEAVLSAPLDHGRVSELW